MTKDEEIAQLRKWNHSILQDSKDLVADRVHELRSARESAFDKGALCSALLLGSWIALSHLDLPFDDIILGIAASATTAIAIAIARRIVRNQVRVSPRV